MGLLLSSSRSSVNCCGGCGGGRDSDSHATLLKESHQAWSMRDSIKVLTRLLLSYSRSIFPRSTDPMMGKKVEDPTINMGSVSKAHICILAPTTDRPG